jgi:hypothetical protein
MLVFEHLLDIIGIFNTDPSEAWVEILHGTCGLAVSDAITLIAVIRGPEEEKNFACLSTIPSFELIV